MVVTHRPLLAGMLRTRLLTTTRLRADKLLVPRRLPRQSVGALTGRAAFRSLGLRSRNRLEGAARG